MVGAGALDARRGARHAPAVTLADLLEKPVGENKSAGKGETWVSGIIGDEAAEK